MPQGRDSTLIIFHGQRKPMPDNTDANQVRTFLLLTSLFWSHFNVEGAKATEQCWQMLLSSLRPSRDRNRGREKFCGVGGLTITWQDNILITDYKLWLQVYKWLEKFSEPAQHIYRGYMRFHWGLRKTWRAVMKDKGLGWGGGNNSCSVISPSQIYLLPWSPISIYLNWLE